MTLIRRISPILTAGVLLLVLAVPAVAGPSTAPGKNPLLCSEALPENCTTNGKTATIDTTIGGGAAVYQEGFNSSWYGVKTGLVKTLSVTVTGDPLGIDPRWSIPIDDRNDPTAEAGFTDYFVFVAFGTCNDGAGLVDVINDPTCEIVTPNGTYPNWRTFTEANTSTYIALNDNYTFMIADGSGAPGVWTISNVKLGKPGK